MGTASMDAFDANTDLPHLLEEVERGQTVTISKRGRVIARLVPVRSRSTPESVLVALRDARLGVRLAGDSVGEMLEEGRR